MTTSMLLLRASMFSRFCNPSAVLWIVTHLQIFVQRSMESIFNDLSWSILWVWMYIPCRCACRSCEFPVIEWCLDDLTCWRKIIHCPRLISTSTIRSRPSISVVRRSLHFSSSSVPLPFHSFVPSTWYSITHSPHPPEDLTKITGPQLKIVHSDVICYSSVISRTVRIT